MISNRQRHQTLAICFSGPRLAEMRTARLSVLNTKRMIPDLNLHSQVESTGCDTKSPPPIRKEDPMTNNPSYLTYRQQMKFFKFLLSLQVLLLKILLIFVKLALIHSG